MSCAPSNPNIVLFPSTPSFFKWYGLFKLAKKVGDLTLMIRMIKRKGQYKERGPGGYP